jgi:hypothetical protein
MPATDVMALLAPAVTISGNVVTFSADDIDAEWDTLIIANSHYLYNVTKGATKAITAKGGTQAAGFTYTVAAIGTWVTGDQIVPIRTNTTSQYATNNLAYIGAAAGDTILTGYVSTALRAPYSTIVGANLNKVMSWRGLLANMRNIVNGVGQYSFLDYSGDLSAAAAASVRNYTFVGCGLLGAINWYNYGGATEGAQTFDRCRFISGLIGIYFQNGKNAIHTVTRCEFLHCNRGIYAAAPTIKAYNNTCLGGNVGIDNYNLASTYKNIVCAGNTIDFSRMTNAAITYSVSADATVPAGTGNTASKALSLLKFWMYNDNNFYVSGGRILTSSFLYNAGNAGGGAPTTDIDMNDISSVVPIGCHKGTATIFNTSSGSAGGGAILRSSIIQGLNG